MNIISGPNTGVQPRSQNNCRNEAVTRAIARLDARHLADLRASGLSDVRIAKSGYRSLGWVEARQICPQLPNLWGNGHGTCDYMYTGPRYLLLPYHDADGDPIEYARIKPDSPRLINGKPAKYESPVGQPNRVWFPVGIAPLLDDPRRLVPLLITEGEKKADKATQEGLPCLGLVGVWGWAKPHHKPYTLNADLADVEWAGRHVFVVFDSDAASNPQVQRAEQELAKALRKAGARVAVVRLPAGRRGEKVGLDDFLVQNSPQRLVELLHAAAPPKFSDIPSSNTEILGGAAFDPNLWCPRSNRRLLQRIGEPGAPAGRLPLDNAFQFSCRCWTCHACRERLSLEWAECVLKIAREAEAAGKPLYVLQADAGMWPTVRERWKDAKAKHLCVCHGEGGRLITVLLDKPVKGAAEARPADAARAGVLAVREAEAPKQAKGQRLLPSHPVSSSRGWGPEREQKTPKYTDAGPIPASLAEFGRKMRAFGNGVREWEQGTAEGAEVSYPDGTTRIARERMRHKAAGREQVWFARPQELRSKKRKAKARRPADQGGGPAERKVG